MARRSLLLAFLALVSTIALALASLSVLAHTEKNFTETKKLIDSSVSCSNLTDDGLELIGEYYMEQMHPGAAHEFMHQRMGLMEGSEAEEKFHISLAKMMYCGELSTGMMGTGMGGMMQSSNAGVNAGMMGAGMWGASSSLLSFNSALYSVLLVLSIIALVLLITWLYRQIRRK